MCKLAAHVNILFPASVLKVKNPLPHQSPKIKQLYSTPVSIVHAETSCYLWIQLHFIYIFFTKYNKTQTAECWYTFFLQTIIIIFL